MTGAAGRYHGVPNVHGPAGYRIVCSGMQGPRGTYGPHPPVLPVVHPWSTTRGPPLASHGLTWIHAGIPDKLSRMVDPWKVMDGCHSVNYGLFREKLSVTLGKTGRLWQTCSLDMDIGVLWSLIDNPAVDLLLCSLDLTVICQNVNNTLFTVNHTIGSSH